MVTGDIAVNRYKEYEIYKTLVDNVFTFEARNKSSLQDPSEFVNIHNYKAEFVNNLINTYGRLADFNQFSEILSSYLYDNYNYVILPTGQIVVPISYNEYMETDSAERLLKSKFGVSTADKMLYSEWKS